MAKDLSDLIHSALGIRSRAEFQGEVTSVISDSREASNGSLFVAIRGTEVDGHNFIEEALKKGAVAAVGELDLQLGVPYLRVPDSRLALAELAAEWHGRPARELVIIGITGTDGKTTTANLLHSILLEAGEACGLITSVNAVIGDEITETGFHVTTPPPMQIQAYLARMVERGLSHCIIEATSHGLAQRRVAACEFDLGVVTNITHEHLDYHGSQQAYLEAKTILFRELTQSPRKPGGPEKTAVLNRDDGSFDHLLAETGARVISYGGAGDFRAQSTRESEAGLEFVVVADGLKQEIRSPLHGRYNVANCLAAVATAVAGLGIPMERAARGIGQLESVPGRMETIDLGQPFLAIVDFAHTPNALRSALRSARDRCDGRVIAVFGSAGLRDREKRRLMAEVAAELADVTILTAEDPRTEPLESILGEMGAAAAQSGLVEGEDLYLIPDRGQAIQRAVHLAHEGDLVIALGKGHEQSMCFGEVEHPWDDRIAMRAALAEHLGVDGPEMPVLPTSPEWDMWRSP